MKDKKNIDRIFQESFKDFEASPSNQVWQNIEKELKKEQSRKPFIIPLWYKVAGVAALFALLFWVGQSVWNLNNTQNELVETNELKDTETKNLDSTEEKITRPQDVNAIVEGDFNSENTSEKTTLSHNDNADNNDVLSNPETSNKATTNINETNQRFTNALTNKTEEKNTKTLSEKEKMFQQPFQNEVNAMASEKTNQSNDILDEKENTAISEEVAETNKKSLLEVLEDKKLSETEDIALEEPNDAKKWAISSYASPIYYDGLGDGSAIDPQFSDNSTETELSLAYGVNVAYEINKRLKVRSGVSKVTHNFKTNGVSFGATTSPTSLKSVTQNSNNGLIIDVVDTNTVQPSIMMSSRSSNPVQLATEFNSDAATFFEGSINQTLGYIEIPVELEYALVDKKLGINIIGGASTLILDENTVSVETRGNISDIGEANNVNNISFSTNVGLGINYDITQKLKFNLEPTFKYQINTFSDSNNFNPYYLGLYTGFSFKF